LVDLRSGHPTLQYYFHLTTPINIDTPHSTEMKNPTQKTKTVDDKEGEITINKSQTQSLLCFTSLYYAQLTKMKSADEI
jgi:hypothetical protein